MTLKKYQLKRKFNKTPEPKGKLAKISKSRFVIHKHDASHLHYDFRLEMDGVLKSWAIPKEPPKTKGIKRLAIQVEDHPIDYINFEGIIPDGNYGAGKVEIWDKGVYQGSNKTLKHKSKKMKSGLDSFKFELKGKKLKGEYVLVRLKDKNWLLFKV
ncbi:3'-phosphoesterase [Patescibacteria group bacterium]|nr:3'-phosphoesterase [Patescibacteria group bacterium]MBU4512145.1 3'-phosphoesterase [Patescibacteria group bacterium]